MRVRVDTAQKIVVAAAILHNICIESHDPQFDPINNEILEDEHELVVPVDGVLYRRRTARDEIVASYNN